MSKLLPRRRRSFLLAGPAGLREVAEELGLEVAADATVDALRAAVQAAYAPDKGEGAGGAAEEEGLEAWAAYEDTDDELNPEQMLEIVDGMNEPDLREAAEELGLEVAADATVDAVRASVQAAYAPAAAAKAVLHGSSSEEYDAAQDIDIGDRRNPLRSFDDRPHCAYMCHTQDTGGAQTHVVAGEFRERYGMCPEGESPGPWLDKWMPSCDAMAMEKGISECKVFFIMMTKGIMSKPYPKMEMRWAKMYGLPIIGVMDKSSAGGKDFIYGELEDAPEDLKYLCMDVEYIPHRTKGYEPGPMMDEIMRRGNLNSADPALN